MPKKILTEKDCKVFFTCTGDDYCEHRTSKPNKEQKPFNLRYICNQYSARAECEHLDAHRYIVEVK